MKTILLLFTLFIFLLTTKAQITTPAVKANFGVDADVMSNFFNGAAQPAYDDWYSNNLAGTGQFIIDTTGAAAILAGYSSNPASRMLSFSRLMRQAPYTVVNNRLLLDAIFHRDFHGDDSTVFASGSNKNGMSPADWACPVAQGIPDKNDILDAFTHVRRAGPNVTDSMWMFSGIAIENTTGSRYFDFELYQTDIYYDRATQTFKNYGPDFGHTSWQFDAAGNVITPGDIIFTAEFGSSSLTLVQARIWINKTSLLTTPAAFSWGGQFDGASSGATYGYASIVPKSAGAFYTGVPCVAGTWAGPFNLVRVDNSVVKNYIANQFLEFSVNLTKLGLDPGKTINNPCGSPFRRVLVKTRSSTSFTSELKDFIAPFSMFNFPKVEADTYITYFCGVMPPTTITVYNPIPTSIYTWTATNGGNIVGSNTGTSIVVDKPGRYIVTQQLDIQCTYYSKDTVNIFFDSVCHVLKVNLLNFTATTTAGDAVLQWAVSNNAAAENYTLEYSYDAQTFKQLTTLTANDNTDAASYSFSYPYLLTNAPVVYYRLRITGKKGEVKYSTIIALQLNAKDNAATIFPNPTTGNIWFAVFSAVKETRTVFLYDAMGKMISSYTINISKGKNIIALKQLSSLPPGTYMVKINSLSNTVTQKIILK